MQNEKGKNRIRIVMRAGIRSLFRISPFAFCILTLAAAPATQPRAIGVPDGWEMAPAGATYTASQTPGEVIVKANGEHPTAGYQAKLVASPLRIWPPQFMLIVKRPDGIVTQVITPFEVSESFKTTDIVRQVVVSDTAGLHEVKVDQARD